MGVRSICSRVQLLSPLAGSLMRGPPLKKWQNHSGATMAPSGVNYHPFLMSLNAHSLTVQRGQNAHYMPSLQRV